MRTVNHNYTADQLGALREQCLNEQLIYQAVGYLSTWNLSFPVVDLCILGGHNELEMIAVYRKEAGGPIGYSIGAVWHGDHFGFHS